MTVNTNLRLFPGLGMSGVIPLLSLYAFMVWTGKFYPFFFLIFPGLTRIDKLNRLIFWVHALKYVGDA